MNIVKLKDIIMPADNKLAEFFNTKLKGRFAYWVQMRYIFPLDSLDYKTYIKYEQSDRIHFLGPNMLPHIDLYSEDSCMYEFAQTYIDHEITEKINGIDSYVVENEYTTDADIDISKIRKFRSWLANEILILNTNPDGSYTTKLRPEQIHMLEYYKDNMYNDIVKYLDIFGIENIFAYGNVKTGCCCNTTALQQLSAPFTCNALDIYTNNIHALMVQTFENVDFWKQLNINLIVTFKKYIDNIIKTGLIIDYPIKETAYIKCNCSTSSINASNELLKNLSDALQYIIDNDVVGHVNFIHDALYNWAEQLYDHMQWDVNKQ